MQGIFYDWGIRGSRLRIRIGFRRIRSIVLRIPPPSAPPFRQGGLRRCKRRTNHTQRPQTAIPRSTQPPTLYSTPAQLPTGAGRGTQGRVAQSRAAQPTQLTQYRKALRSTPPLGRLLWVLSCSETRKYRPRQRPEVRPCTESTDNT